MTKITKEAKDRIVKLYQYAKTLDEISEETGYSKGSIFNTVKAWKREIGEDNVEEIRRFMTNLNQSNISINECTIGFRITNMLKQFNVIDEFERDYFDFAEDDQLSKSKTNQLSNPSSKNSNNDKLYEFISKLYQGCKNHDIRPDDLVNWAENLIEFAKQLDDRPDEINHSNINEDELQSPYKKSYTIPKVSELSTYIERKKDIIAVLKNNYRY